MVEDARRKSSNVNWVLIRRRSSRKIQRTPSLLGKNLNSQRRPAKIFHEKAEAFTLNSKLEKAFFLLKINFFPTSFANFLRRRESTDDERTMITNEWIYFFILPFVTSVDRGNHRRPSSTFVEINFSQSSLTRNENCCARLTCGDW